MVFKKEETFLHIFCNILSIITISTCFILKIPQILHLIKLKNAIGINLIGLLLELSSYTIMFSYNFRNGYALLSYMEYPIILFQEIILIFCVLFYKKLLNIYSLVGTVVYFIFATSFLTGLIPISLMSFLVPLCTPIGASSKVVQFLEIMRTKNSKSVSILTWFISAFTNFTRVFTISVDSGDTSLLLNFTINFMLSLSVMLVAYNYKYPELDIIENYDEYDENYEKEKTE